MQPGARTEQTNELTLVCVAAEPVGKPAYCSYHCSATRLGGKQGGKAAGSQQGGKPSGSQSYYGIFQDKSSEALMTEKELLDAHGIERKVLSAQRHPSQRSNENYGRELLMSQGLVSVVRSSPETR